MTGNMMLHKNVLMVLNVAHNNRRVIDENINSRKFIENKAIRPTLNVTKKSNEYSNKLSEAIVEELKFGIRLHIQIYTQVINLLQQIRNRILSQNNIQKTGMAEHSNVTKVYNKSESNISNQTNISCSLNAQNDDGIDLRKIMIEKAIESAFGVVFDKLFGSISSIVAKQVLPKFKQVLPKFKGMQDRTLNANAAKKVSAHVTKAPDKNVLKASQYKAMIGKLTNAGNTGMKNSLIGLSAALQRFRLSAVVATIAQWGLNTAILSNPITWIIVGIVALIGIIILLVKHWDWVRASVAACFGFIMNLIQGAPDGLLLIISPLLLIVKHFDAVKEAAVSLYNIFINTFGGLGKWFEENVISILPDWLSKLLGGGKTSISSKLEVAQNNAPDGKHSTGLSYVPFDGYIAHLHKGERVLTASENRAYSNPQRSCGSSPVSAGGNVFNIAINGISKSTDEIIGELVYKLREAANTMGEVVFE